MNRANNNSLQDKSFLSPPHFFPVKHTFTFISLLPNSWTSWGLLERIVVQLNCLQVNCVFPTAELTFTFFKKNPVRLLMQWKVQRSLPGLALFTVESTKKKTGVYRMVCHEKLYVLIWTHIPDCFLRRALVSLLELKANALRIIF